MACREAPSVAPAILSAPRVVPSGFFALRSPLLPFEELSSWCGGLEAAHASVDVGAQVIDEVLQRDRDELRSRLREIVNRPEVGDALFVASPSLDESLVHWRDVPESERGQRVERALVRYFSRMCSRPTPFGLFAGCSVGTIGEKTRLEIGGRESYRRHSQLDTEYLDALVRALLRESSLSKTVVFFPNESLYEVSGRLRYVESRINGAPAPIT